MGGIPLPISVCAAYIRSGDGVKRGSEKHKLKYSIIFLYLLISSSFVFLSVERNIFEMKSPIYLSIAIMISMTSTAQDSVCFGINCDGQPDYNGPMPGNPNGFSTWDAYATWSGLTAGLHIPDDIPIQQCFSHCFQHAEAAKDACEASVGEGASTVCPDVYWNVLNNCNNQCQDNPHGSGVSP
jgi:hypothetical protein